MVEKDLLPNSTTADLATQLTNLLFFYQANRALIQLFSFAGLVKIPTLDASLTFLILHL